MTRITTWMLAAAVVAVAALDTTLAHADGKNEIRAVTFDHAGDTTRVIVRGAQTPTFTVYKLERPSRVVLDLPSAQLAESLRGHESAATFTPGTWAVSTIAAQQLDDGGQVVRVIVSLARPGRYDVKTEGNAVVLLVTARDPAPRPTGNPAELARVQAETEQARRAADQAQAEAQKAKLEAERLRKVAADAGRAADEAKRNGQAGQQLHVAALARAQQDAARARQAAQAAQLEADRARVAAETAKRDALADAERARQEANLAKQDVVTSRAELAKTKQAAEAARLAAMRDAETAKANAARDTQLAKEQAARELKLAREAARADLARTRAEAEAAKREMARTRAEAEAVKATAAKDLAAAARAKQEAERAQRDAELARNDVATTRDAATRAKHEADRARQEAAQAKQQAELAAQADQRARAEVEAAKADAAKSIAAARNDARNEIEAAKAEATRARAEAATARADADAAKAAAKVEKSRAETARSEAETLLREAKDQIASLDKKTQQAQALEDKARAANAAAQAREEAARDVAARAMRERESAELAAKQATAAAARASAQERDRMATEARAAEARLAAARRATDEAELKRRVAETAALAAKQQLDQTRTTLATAQQQRTAAETAAAAAARQRGDAEAAALAASRRRTEAETAANRAAKQRADAERAAKAAARERSEAEGQRILAETQRKAAERAARDAKRAADAADRQRGVAERAANLASNKQRAAEAGLAELTTRRQAAERAAAEVEAHSKAEAKAQAEIAAATSRQASEAELARVRAAAARLADERKRAESELADRRKAVAQQRAEATRLAAVAVASRDAASREEARRTELAARRLREEQELARLEQQRAAVVLAASRPVAPVVAARTPAAVAIAKITDIRFKGADGLAQVEVAMSGDGTITAGEQTATHVELIVDHAELGAKLERKLDVSKFGSPVRAVSSYRDRRAPNRVRIVVELATPATATHERTAAGGLTWRFVGAKARVAARTQNVPSPIVGGFGAASTPVAQQTVSQLPAQGARNRRVYRGATVDLDFKDAPIHDLLRALADTGKVNIVVPEGINPKVTVRLKRVPWDQALEVILASHGLWYRRDGNLYRVADRKDLDKEDEAEAARREAMVKSEAPRVDTVALNYASAAELKPKLESMLSPKGRIEVDERTNQLIISDVAGNREQIARLALQLDTQTPQIQIEARIVEARSTFLRQFGIQWGGRALSGAAGGNATGLVFPSSIALVGGNEDANTVRGGVATPSDFAINLPAATGSGEGGALGLSLGSVGGNFNINLRLSALEDSGTVRIISAPKITVLNNKLAKISQGVSIPISVVSAAGTTTQFVQADLSLEVTPYVSQRDCAIAMNINVSKNEPDFVNVGARGDPTILRKEARTTMLVKNGETSVLGGIYTRNSGLAYKKFPFLGDLPVLGWLFKNRRENDDRTEILVFITPKITNKAALRCE